MTDPDDWQDPSTYEEVRDGLSLPWALMFGVVVIVAACLFFGFLVLAL